MTVNKKKYERVLTFGAFNPIHFGHIELFYNIKQMCDYLIVCVSNDEYIRKIKNTEPFFPFKKRVEHVKSIKYVDCVGQQSLRSGKKSAIQRYRPTVLVVGDDWNKSTYTGEGLGVPVIYLPYTPGVCSTDIRKNFGK